MTVKPRHFASSCHTVVENFCKLPRSCNISEIFSLHVPHRKTICHFDGRGGGSCLPGAEKSLPAVNTSTEAPTSLRQFRHSLAVLPWVGSAIVHAAGKVPLDRLPTAHYAGKYALQLDLVPSGTQLVTNVLCEAILHI
jgi:hypothetical protein